MDLKLALRFGFFATLAITLLALLLPAPQVLAAKVWVASWLPGAGWLDQTDITAHGDKWTHALLFAALGWFAMGAWRSHSKRQRMVWILMGVAVVTEVLQAWVPGRSPSLADFLADAVGLAAGAWLGWRVFARSPAHRI
ncbi:MAG: VanZ family protein [Roseovarius sp.]|nr:VanZ family protein [Roseovarius sp.]